MTELYEDGLEKAGEQRSGALAPGVLLSIHMQSNRPQQFSRFLDRLEESTDDLTSVEVVVKIDDTDSEMNRYLPIEQSRRRFRLKFISTPLPDGFYGLWRSMNDMLKVCDENAYFFLNLNDESFFSSKGWDTVLRRYVGLFPDHIFRLRTSPRRYHNYFDFWEAGFANDTAAIMTKRWVEIGGDWCPCNGPDSFQQCVGFYFGHNDRFNLRRYVREIPISDIVVSYDGAEQGLTNVGLSGAALQRRLAGAIDPWFELMSHAMQEEASRRAEKLRAHIWAYDCGIDNFDLDDRGRQNGLRLVERGSPHRSKVFPYRLSRLRIGIANAHRAFNYVYFGGGGRTIETPWYQNSIAFLTMRYDLDSPSTHFDVRRLWAKAIRGLLRIYVSRRWSPPQLLSVIIHSVARMVVIPASTVSRIRRVIVEANYPLTGVHSRKYHIMHAITRQTIIRPLRWLRGQINP